MATVATSARQRLAVVEGALVALEAQIAELETECAAAALDQLLGQPKGSNFAATHSKLEAAMALKRASSEPVARLRDEAEAEEVAERKAIQWEASAPARERHEALARVDLLKRFGDMVRSSRRFQEHVAKLQAKPLGGEIDAYHVPEVSADFVKFVLPRHLWREGSVGEPRFVVADHPGLQAWIEQHAKFGIGLDPWGADILRAKSQAAEAEANAHYKVIRSA